MRRITFAALILSAVVVCASVPNKITYQGRLFKSGVAIEGMHTFRVRILRQNGTPTSYSTVASVNLPASGEFTIVLDNVTGVDWLADNPKLEIAVDGETLSPNEDFTTTAFSFVAKQVDAGGVDTDAIQNGAVTNVKISTVSAAKVMLSNSNVAIASWESGNTGMIDSTKISGSIISAPSAHAITHGNTGSDRVSLDRGQTGGIAIVSTATFVQKIETFNNSTDTFRIYGTAGAQQDAFYPLRVYGTQTPQEEQFNVRGDGQTYVKGNLGVGTQAPTEKLEVAGGNAKISGTMAVGGAMTVGGTATLGGLNVASRIQDQTGQVMPVASIVPFAGSAAPMGWLVCDGSAVSRTVYADLFAAIGVTYGTGNGSTTFNLPDLRGRTVVGFGTGTGLTARTLGEKGGTEQHIHTQAAHNHGGSTGVPEQPAGQGNTGANASRPAHTHPIAMDAPAINSSSSMPPFLSLNYLIKT